MKRLSLLTLLTLAAMGSHAADRVDMTSSLQLKTPTCALSVTPLNSTIAATYAVTQENIDGNTAGTYAFPTATAEYLVSTDEACATLPGFNFQMPTPPDLTGRVDKQITAHRVNWLTNTYLANLWGNTAPDGEGHARNALGTASGTTATGDAFSESMTRVAPGQSAWVSYDGSMYVPSAPASVSVNRGVWSVSTVNDPVTASGGYGGITTITPTLTETDASMTISIGAMFDVGGPRVEGVYDQGAIVNALDYGWTGTLTVTAL